MSQNDPLNRLAEMTAAQDSKRATERARVRAISPELTEIMDQLGPNAKMLHMTVDGVTVAGKPPAPDSTVTISADFYLMACNLGNRK